MTEPTQRECFPSCKLDRDCIHYGGCTLDYSQANTVEPTPQDQHPAKNWPITQETKDGLDEIDRAARTAYVHSGKLILGQTKAAPHQAQGEWHTRGYWLYGPDDKKKGRTHSPTQAKHLAKEINAAIAAALAKERERCEWIAENYHNIEPGYADPGQVREGIARLIREAAQIREGHDDG